MPRFFGKKETDALDDQIEAVLVEMRLVGVTSDKYPLLVTHLEQLNKVKAQEAKPKISRDTMVIVAGNLLGILLIVAYEQKHVLTSKSLSQLIKPR